MNDHETSGGVWGKYKIYKQDDSLLVEWDAFVLRIDGEDMHAIEAMHAYAESVYEFNPALARDIFARLSIINK